MSYRFAAVAVLAVMCATPAMAQNKTSEKSSGMPAAKKSVPVKSTEAYLNALRKNTTTAGKVALAEAAGPRDIAKNATIVEFTPSMEAKTLRQGTNGWTCVSDPNMPMCADETFMSMIGALFSKLQPNTTKVGFAYMLLGDDGASLSDPYATATASDWFKSGPHTMLVVPDAAQLAGLPSKPDGGGPYVMWKGTPYAHVMVPAR